MGPAVGFYAGSVVSACRRAGVAFSITARKNTAIRKAIDAIDNSAWTPIPYWIDGGADIAETTYTAFAGTHPPGHLPAAGAPGASHPGSQLAINVVFDHHAILTDRPGPLPEIEGDHGRHAVVEHVIADLKHHAGLAHLASGKFAANVPWLALIGVAYNLARWTAHAAGLGRVTTKTLRLTIIAAPARLVQRSRRRHLRMPRHWPWADTIRDALAVFARIPAPGPPTSAECPGVMRWLRIACELRVDRAKFRQDRPPIRRG